MTPEQIRKVFAERFDHEEELVWAISMTIVELAKLPDQAARDVSPYKITTLTEGLPHADAIIGLAASIRRRQRAMDSVAYFDRSQLKLHAPPPVDW